MKDKNKKRNRTVIKGLRFTPEEYEKIKNMYGVEARDFSKLVRKKLFIM